MKAQLVFNNMTDLLATANRTLEAACKMFPHVPKDDMALLVLEYLLQNSILLDGGANNPEAN